MNKIRIKRKITSSQIEISGLKDFIGKQVEITVKEVHQDQQNPDATNVAGVLADYQNPNKKYQEKEAWGYIAREKNGNP